MPNNSYILLIFLIFCLFKLFSTKNVIEIEGEQLDKEIKNSNESKFKLFLIFHVKNCHYCTHALKILNEQIIKHFDEEDEIFFGSIDLDNQLNVWLGVRFNITKIPYIILIKDNKMYQFESQFEESFVLKFINEDKNIEDGEDIPEIITFGRKFKVAVGELTENIQNFLKKRGVKIIWNDTMTYVLLLFFFTLFIYIEGRILDQCRNICCRFNKNNNNNIKKNEKEAQEDKNKVKKENENNKKVKKD